MTPSKFATTVLCVALCGCTQAIRTDLPNNWNTFNGEQDPYSIGVPPEFEIGKHAVQGVIQGPGFFDDKKGIDVNIFESSFARLVSSPCSPALTGASVTTPLTDANGKAEWGKVPNQEKSIDPNYPNALCKASREGCKGNPSFEYASGCDTPSAAYALCAEKDGKTVVICIDQMKDDPKMAQQIFETFRWVK